MTARRVTAFVGLGSNLDQPRRQIETALHELAQLASTRLIARSRLYRSAPLGPADQPDYVNAVAALETALAAEALLDALQAIEARHGRRRGVRWGPRTLDLDILLFGDAAIDDARLQVPHPELRRRSFALVPLHDIAPDLRLPDGVRLRDLVDALGEHGLQRLPDRPVA